MGLGTVTRSLVFDKKTFMPYSTNDDLPPAVQDHLPATHKTFTERRLITPRRNMPAMLIRRRLHIESPGRPLRENMCCASEEDSEIFELSGAP